MFRFQNQDHTMIELDRHAVAARFTSSLLDGRSSAWESGASPALGRSILESLCK